MAAICFGAAGAGAATQIGDPCIAGKAVAYEETITTFPIVTPQSPFPAAAPSPGVITSWGMNVSSSMPVDFSDSVTFKVVRPNFSASTALVVGEDRERITPGANTFKVRIPVQAGDLVGMATDGATLVYCEEPSAGSALGALPGNPPTGSTIQFVERHEGESRIPIFATVEPDVDGDGYGDETQDSCATDASTQGPCPTPSSPPATVPPPAIRLSASAAVRKGLVTVTLTDSAQSTVTVGGTVKLGKGKTAKLSGGTQIVAPGGLAKFKLLFPASLKAALQQLPPKMKLSLMLTARAPGATSRNFTVKVAGQKKPTPKHHRPVS